MTKATYSFQSATEFGTYPDICDLSSYGWLLKSTTVGRASTDLRFRYLGLKPETRPTEAHHVMISTLPDAEQ